MLKLDSGQIEKVGFRIQIPKQKLTETGTFIL